MCSFCCEGWVKVIETKNPRMLVAFEGTKKNIESNLQEG